MSPHDIALPAFFLGCDVAKDSVTFFDSRSKRSWTVANKAAALKRVAKSCPAASLAICEATGGYETQLLKALGQAGVPAHRADSVKVKAFIRSFGILGKSDAIDAKALADYGRERHDGLSRWTQRDPDQARLQALAERRRDLVDMRQAEKNRAKAPGAAPIAASIRQVIALLDKQIAKIEGQIKTLTQENQRLCKTIEIMTQMKGIGLVTAANLCAFMPELGSLTRRQAAALAGLAPHPNQSGNTDKYRKIKGGRPQIRKTLFMATMVATKHEPVIRLFYQKLLKAGKKPIVALTAAMRKLIVILNARIRDSSIKQMS